MKKKLFILATTQIFGSTILNSVSTTFTNLTPALIEIVGKYPTGNHNSRTIGLNKTEKYEYQPHRSESENLINTEIRAYLPNGHYIIIGSISSDKFIFFPSDKKQIELPIINKHIFLKLGEGKIILAQEESKELAEK